MGCDAFVVVECRRYTTSRIKQEAVAALAWRIQDTGAVGALLVSPLGLQEGARKVAAAANVVAVVLNADATPQQFVLPSWTGSSSASKGYKHARKLAVSRPLSPRVLVFSSGV